MDITAKVMSAELIHVILPAIYNIAETVNEDREATLVGVL